MSPQKMAETRKALFLLGFSLLSISRFGRVDSCTSVNFRDKLELQVQRPRNRVSTIILGINTEILPIPGF